MNHNHISLLSSFAFPVVCKNSTLRNHYLKQFSGAGIEVRPMIAGNMQNQPFYNKYVDKNLITSAAPLNVGRIGKHNKICIGFTYGEFRVCFIINTSAVNG